MEITDVKFDICIDNKSKKITDDSAESLLLQIIDLIEKKGFSYPEKMCGKNPSMHIIKK